MIGVIVHIDDNFQDQETYLEIVVQTARDLGAGLIVVVDETKLGLGYQHGDTMIAYEKYRSLDEALAAHTDKTKVFLETERMAEESNLPFKRLRNFTHPPEDVLYVTGSEFANEPYVTKERLKGNAMVVVKTPQNYSLWSHVAFALALYDRSIKVKPSWL